MFDNTITNFERYMSVSEHLLERVFNLLGITFAITLHTISMLAHAQSQELVREHLQRGVCLLLLSRDFVPIVLHFRLFLLLLLFGF